MINLIYTILSIVCLSAGFCFGFKIGKDSNLPKISDEIKYPSKYIKRKRIEKQNEKKEEELSKALRNLEKYDGSSLSQEDI